MKLLKPNLLETKGKHFIHVLMIFCSPQARNQSGQTKPYVSRLGSCQCCILKIEILDCNEFGFFWATFGHIQKNISYLTDTFPKQGYKVLFFPIPSASMKVQTA